MVVLITGGAKSGKSTFAERYAAKLGSAGIYIATSPVFDDELQARVLEHQQRREMSSIRWETIEEEFELDAVLKKLADDNELADTVVLVDCLILWLSNWLMRCGQHDAVQRILVQLDRLEQTLLTFPGTLLLVTNEVGYGIVPEYPLGRIFRDLAGVMNQRMAAVSDRVFLVTAGIPIELKSREFKM
ncbi:bifunctional adenosylcobinamide kinase/adenosylcobinamide-phosphate guanylyltransferase [Brevibacillus choshinensis]|uniref:Adenosylcobinamide kinase n=1 Tax=Brevibacillus choshinensis TaxID=54911 RepID=A0ABX7FJ12_BRECH|nr:bifunctional adenosylcobinamide kinase/adenosylcobinamide-phosphate guanylyltransferase [Brevibacillus choshinensis]QRG65850.1 bifunctional adenosylcobinamide kinase/adenosylcobinamide-phosphate guanylyltransferase [Brevibacillus choshinensis]